MDVLYQRVSVLCCSVLIQGWGGRSSPVIGLRAPCADLCCCWASSFAGSTLSATGMHWSYWSMNMNQSIVRGLVSTGAQLCDTTSMVQHGQMVGRCAGVRCDQVQRLDSGRCILYLFDVSILHMRCIDVCITTVQHAVGFGVWLDAYACTMPGGHVRLGEQRQQRYP